MEDDQQFCLRWNNHQSTLISVFDNLLASETLVDCTLAAEGKHLKAHKVVLSACSPYFASLLKEQYDKHPIFILKDVKYQELRYMMDYMYRGEVNISQDQLAALLKAAESLQIKGLSDNRPSVPKPEQQQHQQHQHPHHRATLPTNVGSVSGVVPKYPGSNYTLEQTKRTRLSGRTMGSIDTSEMDSREGSSSPSRKHRKLRRKSQDNAMNDTLDNSNSSQLLQSNQQQHLQQQQQQQQVVNANVVAGLSGVGAITAAASALAAGSAAGAVLHTGPSLAAAAAAAAAAAVASVGPTSSSAGGGGSSVKKTDSLKATSQADTMNIIDSQTAGGSNMSIVASSSVTDAVSDHHHQHQTLHHHQYQAHHTDTTTGTDNKMNHKQKLQQQQQPSSKDIISTNQSELVIEPKSEYDDEANDEAVEDLTLDEEDMGMDDLDQKAGPSQGGEGSSQGYAPWQQDQSQDDLLLNAQEAQQRDPQGNKYNNSNNSSSNNNTTTTNSSSNNNNHNNRNQCNNTINIDNAIMSNKTGTNASTAIILHQYLETQESQQQQHQPHIDNGSLSNQYLNKAPNYYHVCHGIEKNVLPKITQNTIEMVSPSVTPTSASTSTSTSKFTLHQHHHHAHHRHRHHSQYHRYSYYHHQQRQQQNSNQIPRTLTTTVTTPITTIRTTPITTPYNHNYIINDDNSMLINDGSDNNISLAEENFTCPQCYRTYRRHGTLRRHLRQECGKGKSMVCSVCGHRTKRADHLRQHVRKKHPEIALRSLFRRRKTASLNGGNCIINNNNNNGLHIGRMLYANINNTITKTKAVATIMTNRIANTINNSSCNNTNDNNAKNNKLSDADVSLRNTITLANPINLLNQTKEVRCGDLTRRISIDKLVGGGGAATYGNYGERITNIVCNIVDLSNDDNDNNGVDNDDNNDSLSNVNIVDNKKHVNDNKSSSNGHQSDQ